MHRMSLSRVQGTRIMAGLSMLLVLCVVTACSMGSSSSSASLPHKAQVTTPMPTPPKGGWHFPSRPTPTPVPPTPTKPAPTTVTTTMGMLPPGSALPGEAECAARVQRSSWEPRPQNADANHRVPAASQLTQLDPKQNKYTHQITGNFTGTTDEILQWVACKWGIDPDIVRAQAVVESYWVQSTKGGATTNQSVCPPGTWDGKACYQYWGLLQLTYQYWKSAWPMMRDDTAFGAEYVYGLIRTCYDGQASYTNVPTAGYPPYHAGDIWGCMGAWYSGQWYPANAFDYISSVKKHYTNKTWRTYQYF
ncbi:hypothetical protein [Ktedonobacter robiniae]|nr:hypothetical protein [Ktedonobacter robiniae]